MTQDQFEALEKLFTDVRDHADTARNHLGKADRFLGYYLDSAEPENILYHASIARSAMSEALALAETIIKELAQAEPENKDNGN